MNSLAIIGLEACYSASPNLEAFARAVYAGRPPAGASRLSPTKTQALAAQATQGALVNAHLSKDWRLAIVSNFSLDLDRLADRWTIVHSISSEHSLSPLQSSLAEAEHWLAARQADAVLMVIADEFGAGAAVLTSPDNTPAECVLAVIEALSQDLTHATLANLDYLEVLASPGAAELAPYRSPQASLTCALGSGTASPMAALAKVILCLQRRTLPPVPEAQSVALAEHLPGTPFYLCPHARPWFASNSGRRRAALHLAGDHSPFVVLAEPSPHRAVPPVHPQPGETAFYLFPFAAEGQTDLFAQLSAFQQRLAAGALLPSLALETFSAYQGRASAPYALTLTAHHPAELEREIDFAREGIAQAFASGKVWSSPRGSYFTTQPLGQSGVTFVYPGAFNVYVGLGQDLFQHFPGLHERLATVVPDVGRALTEQALYPRRQTPLSRADLGAPAEQLAADPAGMIESGLLFAIGFTWLLRDVFNVHPQLALGYSLGEVSMLWANGIWTDSQTSSAAWRRSPLFKTRLFGPKQAVREAWQRAETNEELWHTYLLKAPLAKVQAGLAHEPHVYVTIINLPDEVVLAGEPAGCRRVIDAIGCHALRVPFDSVLHNPAMQSEQAALAELYASPVNSAPGVTFYSAAHYAPLTLERGTLAQDLARMTCAPLDFPRLVNAAYAGGARLFLELGPQATCTRWIDRILRGRPYAAHPVNRPRTGDYEGVVSLLAMLLSHRVPLDLAPLHGGETDSAFQPCTPETVPVASLPFTADLQPGSEYLVRESAQRADLHLAFMQTRQTMLRNTAELMRLHGAVAQKLAGATDPSTSGVLHLASGRGPVLFDEHAIRAFSQGDPETCFGPAYAIYRGRRLPRLPNRDLLFVSRVAAITGTPGRVEVGARLVAEYDVPAEAWFLAHGSALPYTALMETALQPCGFLSAYLGSILPYPDMDFYFRNLDGEGTLLQEVDVRGQTITTEVRLLSASTIPGILLQTYQFELACRGVPFYRGVSSFGYFTHQALTSQAGLSGIPSPWPHFRQRPAGVWTERTLPRLARGRLELLDKVWLSSEAERAGQSRLYAEAKIKPSDWFFKCHFFQDPVMPGSLGVEAIRQTLQTYVAQSHSGRQGTPVPGRPMKWKYRGQITPQDKQVRLEIRLTDRLISPAGITLCGDANVWNGDTCVYAVQQVGVHAQKDN